MSLVPLADGPWTFKSWFRTIFLAIMASLDWSNQNITLLLLASHTLTRAPNRKKIMYAMRRNFVLEVALVVVLGADNFGTMSLI